MGLTRKFSQILFRLLVWFFHLLYHQLAFLYDWVANIVSNGKWKHWIYESTNFVEEQPILELGFGPGHLQKYLLEKGMSVFGLDESRYMSRLAMQRLRRSTQVGIKMGLCRGIAQNLPFKNETFSTIVATFPTTYIMDSATIQECWRVLRPMGRFVILLGVRHGGNSLYERFLRWLFSITHQTIEDSDAEEFWKDHYTSSGFQVDQVWHPFEKDRLWFIVAEKRATPFAND
ncbi:MAG: class I SAM-dependent methyltransferase [Bellilinea sp.]|nr:class I SAM-dependent methyltransferase [Bellilinea sp.]